MFHVIVMLVLLSLLGEGLAIIGGSVAHLAVGEWLVGHRTAVGEMGFLLMSHTCLHCLSGPYLFIHLMSCALL